MRRITRYPIAKRRLEIDFRFKLLALPSLLQQYNATYTRNTAKTVFDQYGVRTTLANNQFGTTWDSVAGRYAFECEPAATNLATNSEGAAATWSLTNVTDASTPISGFAASLQFGDNSAVSAAYKVLTLTTNTIYTVSVFVQMDDGNAPVVGTSTSTGDFAVVIDGNLASASALVFRLGISNIYRVSTFRTASVGGASRNCGIVKYTTQSARSFRVTGIQVETAGRATSYIQTAGSAVVRNADVLFFAPSAIPGFTATAYTLFSDVRADSAPAGFRGIMGVNDGTTANRATIYFGASGTAIPTYLVQSSSITQATGTRADALTNRVKIGSRINTNNFCIVANGSAPNSDNTGATPMTLNRLDIGSRTGSNEWLNGFIYRSVLYPQALTDGQLQGLTT